MHMYRAVYAMARHTPTLYRHGSTDQVGFGGTAASFSDFYSVLSGNADADISKTALLSVTLSQTLNLDDFLRFRHGTSTVEGVVNSVRSSPVYHTERPLSFTTR